MTEEEALFLQQEALSPETKDATQQAPKSFSERAAGRQSVTTREELAALLQDDEDELTAADMTLAAERPSPKTKKRWGTSYSPDYPTEREMLKETEKLFARQAALTAEVKERQVQLRREFLAQSAQSFKSSGQLNLTQGKSTADTTFYSSKSSSTSSLRYRPHPPQPEAGWRGQAECRTCCCNKMDQLSERAWPTPARRKPERYEPAKVVDSNGKKVLRGVKPVSDIRAFSQEVQPYSKRAAEARLAFKYKRMHEQRATVGSAWNALHQFLASDQPLKEWEVSARKGVRYEWRRT